jgi:hypothetical protein
MQLDANDHEVIGILSLEKVLEAILNQSILDEKDFEKMRTTNRSVTMHEESMGGGHYDLGDGDYLTDDK